MSEIIGYANENISSGNVCYEESSLGNLVADAACEMLHADIAIVFSKDLEGYLLAGELTKADVANVVPSDSSYSLLYLNEEDIRQILEYGVSSISLTGQETIDANASQTDFFPQVSGMSYRCDASAPPGERIMSLQLEYQETYLAIVPTQILSMEQRELTDGEYGIRTLFEQYIVQKGTLSVPQNGRIEIVGAYANSWFSDGMFLMVLLIAAMISLMQIPYILSRRNDIGKRESLYLTSIFHKKNRKSKF